MTKDDLELYLYRWKYGPDSEMNAYELVEHLWDLFYPLVPDPNVDSIQRLIEWRKQ